MPEPPSARVLQPWRQTPKLWLQKTRPSRSSRSNYKVVGRECLAPARSSASHNGDSADFKLPRAEEPVIQTMLRQYSPFVALAFGPLLTLVWVTLVTWFPVQLATSAIVKVLSDITW
jgi:hypothetical protein